MARVFGASINNVFLTFFCSLLCCAVFLSVSVAQQAAQPAPQQEPQQESQQVDKTPLRELGDEYHNSIKLLQNRFRIDYEVDEITMVFFRRYGSAPVVLVRPDGSKIFQAQADGDSVFWYDSASYDLINIKNPTPGPWQAVGQILPDSRVMVISDIQLIADPLPETIFSGEILKQTARLTNGGEPINNAEFRDVVSLDIRLVSTNNPNYNNFGAEVQTIATFVDNGRGMDEQPLDGVFTGQFNLAVADGEWTPVFVVSTPMLTREQVDPPLMLYPNPIKIDMIPDGGGEGYHKLIIDAQREHVDINTLLIDGKIRFPNGDVQNFSLTEPSSQPREFLIVNYEAGVYRIKLTAYGNTVNGRDFILDVPEYTFLFEEEIEPAAPLPVDSANIDQTLDEATSAIPADSEISEVQTELDGMSQSTLYTLIAVVNVVILVFGAGLIWFLINPRKAKVTGTGSQSDSSGKKPSVINKLQAKFKNKKSPPPDSKKAPTKDPGMMDLSLPKK